MKMAWYIAKIKINGFYNFLRGKINQNLILIQLLKIIKIIKVSKQI